MTYEHLSYQHFVTAQKFEKFTIISESSIEVCTFIELSGMLLKYTRHGDPLMQYRTIDFGDVIDGMYVDSDSREVCFITKVPMHMLGMSVMDGEYFYLDPNIGKLNFKLIENSKSGNLTYGDHCSVNSICKLVRTTHEGVFAETVIYTVTKKGMKVSKAVVKFGKMHGHRSTFILCENPKESTSIIVPSKI